MCCNRSNFTLIEFTKSWQLVLVFVFLDLLEENVAVFQEVAVDSSFVPDLGFLQYL